MQCLAKPGAAFNASDKLSIDTEEAASGLKHLPEAVFCIDGLCPDIRVSPFMVDRHQPTTVPFQAATSKEKDRNLFTLL